MTDIRSDQTIHVPVKVKPRGMWVPTVVKWTPGPLKPFVIRRLIGFVGADVTTGTGSWARTMKMRCEIDAVEKWKQGEWERAA